MALKLADTQVDQDSVMENGVAAYLETLPVSSEVHINTPRRVVRALYELTSGYRDDPATILSKQFDCACDEMVAVCDVEFASLCAHHMLPFTGTVSVAYIPTGSVVGLSKIPRLIHCYARRLQIQETMTNEIADAMDLHLQPLGVGVLVRGYHTCMAIRGVRSRGEMVTSALRGAIRTDASARAEFLACVR